jgi:hypothetical protein
VPGLERADDLLSQWRRRSAEIVGSGWTHLKGVGRCGQETRCSGLPVPSSRPATYLVSGAAAAGKSGHEALRRTSLALRLGCALLRPQLQETAKRL